MSAMASQITSLPIVYPAVYSRRRSKKHQSSASLAFVRGIHRWPVNFPHKGPVTRKMFPLDDVIVQQISSSFCQILSQSPCIALTTRNLRFTILIKSIRITKLYICLELLHSRKPRSHYKAISWKSVQMPLLLNDIQEDKTINVTTQIITSSGENHVNCIDMSILSIIAELHFIIFCRGQSCNYER